MNLIRSLRGSRSYVEWMFFGRISGITLWSFVAEVVPPPHQTKDCTPSKPGANCAAVIMSNTVVFFDVPDDIPRANDPRDAFYAARFYNTNTAEAARGSGVCGHARLETFRVLQDVHNSARAPAFMPQVWPARFPAPGHTTYPWTKEENAGKCNFLKVVSILDASFLYVSTHEPAPPSPEDIEAFKKQQRGHRATLPGLLWQTSIDYTLENGDKLRPQRNDKYGIYVIDNYAEARNSRMCVQGPGDCTFPKVHREPLDEEKPHVGNSFICMCDREPFLHGGFQEPILTLTAHDLHQVCFPGVAEGERRCMANRAWRYGYYFTLSPTGTEFPAPAYDDEKTWVKEAEEVTHLSIKPPDTAPPTPQPTDVRIPVDSAAVELGDVEIEIPLDVLEVQDSSDRKQRLKVSA